MPIRRIAHIAGCSQPKLVDDRSRTKIKDILSCSRENLVAVLAGAERVHTESNRVGFANRVTNRHLAPGCKIRIHHGFRDQPRHISTRPVNLRSIFTTESSTTMSGQPAIGVNHKFSASESGVSFRAALHEPPRRIHQNSRVLIDRKIRRASWTDNHRGDFTAQHLEILGFIVLDGNHHRLYGLRFSCVVVAHRN